MKKLAVVMGIVFLAASAHAQAVWVGPAGGGMMAVQEPQVLKPRDFIVGLTVDNYDRDPLGLDINDARITLRAGLIRRLEFSTRYDISRAVCVPGDQPVPPPPLYIMDQTGRIHITQPYRTMYWPMPYLKATHGASITDMIPGQQVLGLKYFGGGQHGLMPAWSVSADIVIPDNKDQLEKGAGSDTVDPSLYLATQWKKGKASLTTNLGITRWGRVQGDQLASTMRDGIIITDLPIIRPNQLHYGVGIRYQFTKFFSAMGEYAGWAPVGSHTPMQDEFGATDALAGLEWHFHSLSATAGVRQHLYPQKDGLVLPTGPLAGTTIDTSMTLDSRGVSPIPPTRQTHTTGNTGMVFALSLKL